MGGCSSSGFAQGLENRCAGQLRRARASGSVSSSSSSSGGNGNDGVDPFNSTSTPTATTRSKAVADTSTKPECKMKTIECIGQQLSESEQKAAADGKPKRGEVSSQTKRERFEKLKEGVDFIETEEDAEAVESAVVKIQSTFRGKKIRSKLGAKTQETTNEKGATATTTKTAATKATDDNNSKTANASSTTKQAADEEEEALNKEVAGMQVNDNSGAQARPQEKEEANAPNLPEDADRAAAKIQAGFKGYKTRKELESKQQLGQQQTVGQQEASGGNQTGNG